MVRNYFLHTDRLGFSTWTSEDLPLALELWGDPAVTHYICASGAFSTQEVEDRLHTEIANESLYQVQYWPLFSLDTSELVGCCGLRPHGDRVYELGVHLRPQFWGQGFAQEAASAAIHYAFDTLGAKKLFAGHNPQNERSRALLSKLGFTFIGTEFYEPTGLYHPSYELENPQPRDGA